MDPPTLESLAAEVAALRVIVEQQGAFIASLAASAGPAVRAGAEVGQRPRTRQRHTTDELAGLAAELIVIVQRHGNVMPDDATLASALGVPVKTFGKWRRDARHPVGRRYAAIVSAIGGPMPHKTPDGRGVRHRRQDRKRHDEQK